MPVLSAIRGDCLKRLLLRLFLLLGYGIPFAFLAVHFDAVAGSMLFYGIMIAGFALLCRFTWKAKTPGILYIGNILSLVASLTAAKFSGLEPMGHYFKPFTSTSLIIFISAIVMIVQIIASRFWTHNSTAGTSRK